MLKKLYVFLQNNEYIVKNLNIASVFYSCIVKIFTVIIGISLAREIFYLSLSLADLSHFGVDNALYLFINPFSLAVFIIYLLLIVLLVCAEVFILIYLCLPSKLRGQVSVRVMVRKLLKPEKSFAFIEILLFIAYIVLTVRLTYIGLSLSLTSSVYMPTFFIDEFLRTGMFKYFVYFLSVFIMYVNIRFMYTFPIFVLEHKNFSRCLFESFIRTKAFGSCFKDVFKIVCIIVILLIGKTLIYKMIMYSALFLDPSGENIVLYSFVLTLLRTVNTIFEAILKLSTMTILIHTVVESDEIEVVPQQKKKKHVHLKVALSILLSISVFTADFVYQEVKLSAMRVNKGLTIVAHRGFTKHAVENTLEALEGVKEAGLKYAEVDIMMTKDQKFIAMHDFNLFRLAKINADIKDMFYDDLVGMEISNNGFTGHIVSFDDYVKKAQELGIELIVEIKLHGGEPDNYVDLFMDKMRELGIDDRYKVMSLDLDVVEKIHKRYKYMDIGYIMPFYFGNLFNADVDFFVVEDFSYREHLVWQALLFNKKIYIWTVNKDKIIEKYVYSPVAGIISDYPDKAKEIKENIEKYNTLFDKIRNLVEMEL